MLPGPCGPVLFCCARSSCCHAFIDGIVLLCLGAWVSISGGRMSMRIGAHPQNFVVLGPALALALETRALGGAGPGLEILVKVNQAALGL